MRILCALAVLGLASACTSVRMAQRDGCWVRQTEKWPNRITEELGPCARAEARWSDDRLTRLVQECVAQADHRWQTRALQTWNSGDPLPQQGDEAEVLEQCMTQASQTLLTENEALKTRLAELDHDRATLKSAAAEDREHLRDSHDRVLDALAEAAKKPAPAAVATATSNGTAHTTSDLSPTASALSPAAAPLQAGALCAAPGTARGRSTGGKGSKTPAPPCDAARTAAAPAADAVVPGPAPAAAP